MKKIFIFLIILFLYFSISYAGQTIDLNGNIEGVIAGNGQAPNGTEPFDGDPNGNIVYVGNIVISGDVIITGSENDSIGMEIVRNIVRVNGSVNSIINDVTLSLVGGSGYTCRDNIVDILKSTINNNNESRIDGANSNDGDCSGNKITISDSQIVMPNSRITGGFSRKGSSLNNTVTISGGFIHAFEIIGGLGSNAESNTVTISSGARLELVEIYGGLVDYRSGVVKNNIINIDNIGEKPISFNNVLVSGGFGGNISNNTVILRMNYKELKITQFANFQNCNFFLCKGIKSDDIVLMIDSGLNLYIVTIALSPDNTLKLKESINIIHYESSIDQYSKDRLDGQETEGTFETLLCLYKSRFKLSLEGNNIVATLLERYRIGNPKAVSYLSGRASLMCFLNQTFDFVRILEVPNFIGIHGTGNYVEGLHAFGEITGGKSEFSIGQGLKIDGFRGIAGIGNKFEFAGEDVIWGAFCEFGKGWYKAKNESDTWQVNAKGKDGYICAGVTGKIGFGEDHAKLKGTCITGSMSAGVAQVSHETKDIETTIPQTTDQSESFDSSVMKLFLCCSRELPILLLLNRTIYPEVFGQYGFVYLGEQEVFLSSGEMLHFYGTWLNSITIGLKGNCEVKPGINVSSRLSLEQSIGRVRAEILDPLSLTGTTAKLGISGIKNIKNRWRIDLGLEVFIGHRRGFVFGLNVVYPFGKSSSQEKSSSLEDLTYPNSNEEESNPLEDAPYPNSDQEESSSLEDSTYPS